MKLILTVLEYIEENLRQDLTAETLAEIVGYSKTHFSRLFIFTVGTSVMDYINKRRMIHAAFEIKNGKKIMDCLLDYGFDTQTGFNKSFKKTFGMTPSNFRKKMSIDIPPLIIKNLINNEIRGDILMEPKIITKEDTKIIGYSIITSNANGQNNKAIPAFWNEYLSDGRMEKLHSEPFVITHAEYGVCLPISKGQTFKYLIGVEYDDKKINLVAGYDTAVIPKSTYAVFTTPKANNSTFTKNIQDTWRFIYQKWMPNNEQYDFNYGHPDFELYDERCMGNDNKVIDIYIPIKIKNKA